MTIPGGLSGFTNLSPPVKASNNGTFTASVECTISAECNGGPTPDINDLHFTVTNATLAQLQVPNAKGNLYVADVIAPPIGTPIPAAFPLFATGLSGLGLLGWRRKTKGASGRLSNVLGPRSGS